MKEIRALTNLSLKDVCALFVVCVCGALYQLLAHLILIASLACTRYKHWLLHYQLLLAKIWIKTKRTSGLLNLQRLEP
jgi:hypothetical protein